MGESQDSTKFDLAGLEELENLGDLFDHHVACAVGDALSRPTISKPRTITLKLHVAPSKKNADNVKVWAEMNSKLPAQEISSFEMTPNTKNELRFWPESPLGDPNEFNDDDFAGASDDDDPNGEG